MAASGMYDVFRLHELKAKMPYKLESVASWGDLFFLGTSEGKIIVSEITKAPSTNSYDCNIMQIEVSKIKAPIRRMVPVPEKNVLVVLIGEIIVLHHLPPKSEWSQQGRAKMPEIGPVRGAKEVIDFHIKRDRGNYFMAIVLRKKVMVFELREQGAFREFVLVKDGLALPEGIRTVTWSGKNLLLGFRKEYVMMDTTSGDIDSLFATAKNSNQPVVTNLEPIPELLVGDETVGVRINLSGEPAAKSGIVWASLPTWMTFHFPFLLSIHDGNSIEIRNPLIAPNNSDGTSRAASGILGNLCQTLSVKYVDRVSASNFVNFDVQRPDAKSDPGLFRHDAIIATTGSSSVYLLELIPMREQVMSLAASKNFEGSLKLASLCPNEVPLSVVNDVKVMYGLHCFSLRRFPDAIAKFSESNVDVRFVVSLFPDFLPAYVKANWKPSRPTKGGLDARELSECIEEALISLIAYLTPQRDPPSEEMYHRMSHVPPQTDEASMIQATIDTAILRSFVLLGREDALVEFLTRPNACVLEDSETFLKENRQWNALVTLWKGRSAHEESMHLLYTLGVCGTPMPSSDHRPLLFGQQIVKIVDDILAEDGLPDEMLSQSDIEKRFDALPEASDVSQKDRTKIVNQLVGILGSLFYLRILNMGVNSEKVLFSQYCGWLLANLDPIYSLTIFTKAAVSKHDHNDVVKLLNNVGEEGSVTAVQRIVRYLEIVLGDQCNAVDDRDLHNERVKSLIQIVMEERQPDDIKMTMSHKKLSAFLQKSVHYDPVAAVQWLSTGPYAKSFYRERALVYKRLKKHGEAISMFLNEVNSLDEAKAYATSVSQEEGDAFQILLRSLLQPSAKDGSVSNKRVTEALRVVNECEGVDARTALPMLPDDTDLASVKDFISKSLRSAHSKAATTQIYANVLRNRVQQARVSAVRVKSKNSVIDTDTVCAECQRKIRPDTVFARYPNGVMVHQACLDNEFICPQTHKDFRTGVETILY